MRRKTISIIIGILILIAAILLAILPKTQTSSEKTEPASSSADTKDEFFKLELTGHDAKNQSSSNIYVLSGTEGEMQGIDRLIDMMGDKGLYFYKSSKPGKNAGSDGIIAPDDVVLLEINCQWDYRGGTNTDLIKSVIQKILNHPDNFNGEIIVADNGQGQYGGKGYGGSMDWEVNNAKDRSQSVQDVVDSFTANNKVSAVLWDTMTKDKVEEYSSGDMEDGFIIAENPDPETGIIVSYPKFKTKYGTYVSFKEGIWDNSEKRYDSGKLKVISMPVLKAHLNYYVTGCIKKYMGVTSDKLTNHNAHDSIGYGGMGTEMVETRMPDLNILDAIWINPVRGPMTPDGSAVKTGIIAAGTDAVALDYWASSKILMKAAEKTGNPNSRFMDPGDISPGHFGYWLKLSADEIKKAGYPAAATMDEINVYIN